MDVQLPDGTVVTNVPDGISQSELMRRMGRSQPGMPQNQVNWGVELDKQIVDEMSAPERVFRSLGAGFADIPLAVKQIFNRDPGKAKQLEKEAADKREVDKYLSKKTDMGFAPDKVLGMNTPTVGDAAQFYGKTAPTMLLPASRLATLPGFVGNVGTGAALAALDPTVEGESRAQNRVMGGAASAVLPAATAIYRGGRNMVTRSGGQTRAADELAKTLTPEGGDQGNVLRQTIERLRNASQPNGGPDIPLSTAARLRDAEVARLEAGSRARNGANWYDFDQNQARAVAGELDRATADAAELTARRGTRSANWNTNWNDARGSIPAGQGGFAPEVSALRKNIDVAMRSEESSNPAVMNMLKSMADEIDRLGPDFGPGNLQQIRANLSGRFNPMNPNAYAAAPRDSAARLSVMQDLDNILNRTTGNKWQGVVDNYAADSRLVDQAKAAGRVRQNFYDQATGRVQGVSADAAGDVPKITEAGLGRAMNAARGPDKSLLLSNEANTRLESILDALRAQNIVQGVKRSATAGGGSNTAGDMFAAKSAGAAADAVTNMAGGPAATVGKGVLSGLRDYANANKDRALAEALQNPQQMIGLLERKLAANVPLTASENYVLALLRGAPAAAATN